MGTVPKTKVRHATGIVLLAYCWFLFILLLSNPAWPGDVNFAMDDGYIYANYVRNGADGHFFEYNAGEKTGGITGLLWFLAWVALFYPLRFLTEDVRALHMAGYILAALCMMGTLAVVFRFTQRLYQSTWVSILVCLFVAADAQLLWAALSGLEIPLTTFVMCSMLWAAWEVSEHEATGTLPGGRQRKRCFALALLLLSALAYWCRPEVVLWSAGIALFLQIQRTAAPPPDSPRTALERYLPLWILLATALGIAAACAIYHGYTQQYLPSSFYAKVTARLTLSAVLQNARDVIRQFEPYETFLYAFGGWLAFVRRSQGHELRSWLLPVLAILCFLAAKALTFPTLGQEHRYISPLKPVLILFSLGEIFLLLRSSITAPQTGVVARPAGQYLLRFALVFCFAVLTVSVSTSVTELYQGWINARLQGDIRVGKWLRANTPPDAVVASEPIGSIHLYSQRFTVDVVGLTTREFAGHYPDWAMLFPLLERRRASYLVYYPQWFRRDGVSLPLPWLRRVASFNVDDDANVRRGLGSSPIEIYRLDWAKYRQHLKHAP